MIYRTMACPDLQPCFRHVICRPMAHSYGHDVLSDWADKPDDDRWRPWQRCGFWTHDEAAILYQMARALRGRWMDIGAHTGWTTAHLLAAGCDVRPVDYMLSNDEFHGRFHLNVSRVIDKGFPCQMPVAIGLKSAEVFRKVSGIYTGFVIDGSHEPPDPLLDARSAARHIGDHGVILLHDGTGEPVRVAARWLRDQGFAIRVYQTPHMVIAASRGDVTLPEHVPDPFVARHVPGELS